MTTNLLILSASLLILIITFWYAKLKWSHFDIFNLYLIFVGLYFGLYPFIKACLESYSQANVVAISLVFLQLLFILVIMGALFIHLPATMRQSLEITSLLTQWAKGNTYVIFLILGIILFVQVIGYERYGIISHVDHGDLAKVGRSLPYWYSSILALLSYLIFVVFIGLSARIWTSQGLSRKLLFIPLLCLGVSAAIYGRRSLINLVIIGVLLWFISQRKDMFRFKYAIILLALLLSLFGFSNIYQSYREALQFPTLTNLKQLKNPISAALAGSSTLNNIRQRPATWEFNYLIFESTLTGKVINFTHGTIIWQGIKNSIPNLLWPNKVIQSLNNMTANYYGLPVIDYGKNNFAVSQADFGYFSVILLPIIMLIVFISLALIIKYAKNYPTLLLILSGSIINYLINIEEDGAEIFIMYRNLLLFALLYFAGYFLLKVTFLCNPTDSLAKFFSRRLR